MKKMIKILIIVLLATSFSKCDRFRASHYPIYLINNAEHSIGFYFALGGRYGTRYPDTLLPKTNQYIVREVKPGRTFFFYSGTRWEDIFSKKPEGIMSAFIFHTDTLNRYTWEEVRDGYMILKRYDLSLDDLQRLNFHIYYPPTEAMRNIRQFPPFGQ